jgi:hypothetical protein
VRKLLVLFVCFVTIISLFAVNNETKSFSFENYLTEISIVAEDRPKMPSTEFIESVFDEYGNYEPDTSGILKAIKAVWTTLKLIYEYVVFACRWFVYCCEFILYVIDLIVACTYNLLVW